ncbi:hypothetical protein [Sinobaca sp. H24]|uniref:hypothetical protein n=1 Tax=Sinobaca sp. H24 TaxID=2923376 RepID=UPI00207A4299|nr:hypothetical protein [Sinobaca sp. H24]
MNITNDTFINLIYIPTSQTSDTKELFADTLLALKRSVYADTDIENWNGFQLGEEFQLGSYKVKVVAIVPTHFSSMAEYDSSSEASHVSYYLMSPAGVQ